MYFRYHIKKGLALGKGLKILRYQDFTKKNNQAQKRKEKKRKEIKKKEEDVEDEYNVFCNEIFISTLWRHAFDHGRVLAEASKRELSYSTEL